MSGVMTGLIVATFVAVAAIVVWGVLVTWRESLRRLAMLDGVMDRFPDARRSKSPWRYPRIEATLDGSPVRLDLIPDTMVRKDVPSMWGEIRWQRSHPAALYVTVDPKGAEYLPDCDIHQRRNLSPPADWPPRTHVCGDSSRAADLLARLDDLDLTAYPRLKQLAITRDEIAVTIRCAKATRRPRLLVPSNDFTTQAVEPAVIDQGLRLLADVEQRLAGIG